MWKTIKQIVENNDTKRGRVFDFVLQSLILVSIVSYSLETLPDLKPGTRRILRFIEVGTVIVFTMEYLLRLFVADRKFGFIFSFFGIVDLLAILPFYVGLGIDLRSIRAIRLFRLFRMLKIARYNRALQRFHRAFLIAREELVLFLLAASMLLYFSAAGVYHFEHEAQPEVFTSIFTSLWWGVVTLTTVGYGDMYPITTGGRFFTMVILMIGLGVVAVPAGLVASALTEAREMEEDKAHESNEDVEHSS